MGLSLRVSSLVVALMLLVTGGAHLQSSFREWCPQKYADCFTPWLFWNSDGFFHSTNGPLGNTYFGPNYGKVFSLEPTLFVARWGPLFLGMIGFLEHVGPAATGLPYRTPGGMLLWHLFMALFVAFPCAGNFGIITGMACLFVCVLCAVGTCVDLSAEPLTFGHYKDGFLFKLALVFSSVHCGAFLVPLMKVSSLITAILVTVLGLVHIGNQMRSWCSDADPVDYQCVGPWLFFNSDDFFKETKNCYSSLDHCEGLYGSVFTIEPKVMCCLWLPFFFGAWALMEHVKVLSLGMITGSGRAFFFHLFLALFVCFPCAGNFGILVGVWCGVPILISLLMIVFCPTANLQVNFAKNDGWVPDTWKHSQDVMYHQLELQTDEEKQQTKRHSRPKQSKHTKVVTMVQGDDDQY